MNDDGYEVEDCQKVIDQAKSNIATLQEGIDREQENIDHFEKIKAALIAKAELVDVVSV